MITKKLLVLLAVGLFIVSAVLPAIDCKSMETKKTEFFLNDKSELGVNYIEASSSYGYGLKAGRLFGFQYRIINYLANSKHFKLANEEIKKQIDSLEKYCPSTIEEFKGLSTSTHIKLERLILLQNFLESILSQECTATASTGNATKNNETFLTQNMDLAIGPKTFVYRFIYSHLLVKKVPNEYSYVYWGMPIFWEKIILNEKGLALVGNDIVTTNDKDRTIDRGPGISFGNWLKMVMTNCKNVSEVVPYYKGDLKPSTQAKDFSNDVWADGEGNIMDVEMTYHYLITVFGNSTDITGTPEGILWHSNHHLWLDPYLTGSQTPEEYPISAMRAERARELLIENYGNITVEILEGICSDHGGGFNPNKKDCGDICTHLDSSHPIFIFPTNVVTTKSIIIEPKSFIVYLANGPPCHTNYVKHDFSKIFGK
jgi:hypothetical protein